MFGSNPDIVLKAPVDIVIKAYHYEQFVREYETTFTELNSKGK